MKYQAVLFVLLVAFILGLLGIIHARRNMEIQLSKTSYLESVKLRVTSDVLKELQSNIDEANIRLALNKKRVADLTTEAKAAQGVADTKKAELDTCNNELNQIKADVGALETEKSKSDSEFQQNIASMTEQVNNLKKEFGQRSKVCDYVNKTSAEGMKLCGLEVVQPAPKTA